MLLVVWLTSHKPKRGRFRLTNDEIRVRYAFIASRRADCVKTTTINLALGTVRRILNLAASEWRDERGMTWLEHAAKIKLLPAKDKRAPYPLSREEQSALFQGLPDYLSAPRTSGRSERETRRLTAFAECAFTT